jgi:glucokinase
MPFLGLDLAEGRATAVLVDASGAVLERAKTIGAGGAREMLQELAKGQEIEAFGVAASTPAVKGVTVSGVPAPSICRPGDAAVVAEAWVGAARGSSDVVCLLVGERVFAGILLGGQPWRGAHGMAGAAAWLALNPVERQDYRKFGSFAAEVSNSGIALRLAWRVQAGDESDVVARAGGLDSITAAHVFDGARRGDGVAGAVVRDTARYIAMAAVNLATALDPQVVVLGGEAAAAGDLLLEPVRQECARRLPPGLAQILRLEVSTLADDAVAIGAARLARPA